MMKVISGVICLIWLWEEPESYLYLHNIPFAKHEVQSQTAFCCVQYINSQDD